MQFHARLVKLGRVAGIATLTADTQADAEREANEGIDVLAGTWVEVTPVPEHTPERAEVVREAVETMKHPENIGAG